jgi:RNA polymerase sigma factor (sigma-70 family)
VSEGTRLLQRLRESVLRPVAGEVSDGQLLDRYLAQREEAAFALLLRRHGPMVLGVCRRVLRHEQDAEDAFQATFLVLARRAVAVEPREQVGPWLYGVAYRTALKARALAVRRRQVEREAARPDGASDRVPDPDDLRPLLDQHLSRLPDRYRVPLLLCDLEGRPRKDVARQLGLPEGTLSSRLARARQLLGRRLRRAGAALSEGALAILLTAEGTAALPPSLATATTGAALAVAAGQTSAVSAPVLLLTEGVLQAMMMTRLKIATVVLLSLAVIGLGTGVLTHRALADKPGPAAKTSAADSKKGKEGKEEVGPTVNAVVKAVDAGKHTLTTMEGNKKEAKEKTYELSKDARVILNDGLTKGDKGKDGSLSDVKPGLAVELQLTPGGKAVSNITVRPWEVHADLRSVDADKRTITIATKGTDGPVEATYTLAKGARVLLSDGLKKGDKDQEGKLADLTQGTPVRLRVSAVDPKTILEVRPQGRSLYGELKGVDAGNNQLTITVKEDGALVDKVLTLAKNSQVSIDDGKKSREAKLADLTIGSRVLVQLSVFDPAQAARVTVREGDN